eukprot:m.173914 g.173914  ORF g.173914 m.173914 type:complete len:1165 (-) comp10412_c0_seq3:2412-5906(-)
MYTAAATSGCCWRVLCVAVAAALLLLLPPAAGVTSWEPVPPFVQNIPAIAFASSSPLPSSDTQMLLLGGFIGQTADHPFVSPKINPTAYVLDVETKFWSEVQITPALSPLGGSSLNVLHDAEGNQYCVSFSGWDGAIYSNKLWTIKFNRDSITSATSQVVSTNSKVPAPRWGHTVVTSTDRTTMYMTGGRTEHAVESAAELWSLKLINASSGTWTLLTVSNAPSSTFLTCFGLFVDKMTGHDNLAVFGGFILGRDTALPSSIGYRIDLDADDREWLVVTNLTEGLGGPGSGGFYDEAGQFHLLCIEGLGASFYNLVDEAIFPVSTEGVLSISLSTGSTSSMTLLGSNFPVVGAISQQLSNVVVYVGGWDSFSGYYIDNRALFTATSPQQGVWQPFVSPQQVPPGTMGGAFHSNGSHIFMFGGWMRSFFPEMPIWTCEMQQCFWSQVTPKNPIPNAAFGTAVGGEGHVILYGGIFQESSGNPLTSTSVYRFDLVDGEVEILSSDSGPQVSGHISVLYDNAMYVFGGARCNSTSSCSSSIFTLETAGLIPQNTLYRFDLSTLQWTTISPKSALPQPRAYSGGTVSERQGKGVLFVYGGSGSEVYGDLWFYEFERNVWVDLLPFAAPGPLAGQVIVPLSPFKFALVSGSSSYAGSKPTYLNSIYTFSTIDDSFQELPIEEAHDAPTYGFAAVKYGSQAIFMFGGAGIGGSEPQVFSSAMSIIHLGCDSGFEADNFNISNCVACPIGTFSPDGKACTPCGGHTTTSSVMSISQHNCTLCQPGICNHGACSANADSATITCHCHLGYSGSRCQTPLLVIAVSSAIGFIILCVAIFSGYQVLSQMRSSIAEISSDRSLKERLLDQTRFELAEMEESWRIDYSRVKLVRRLAEGSFGEVWLATWQHREVAVKRIRSDHAEDSEAMSDFSREVGGLRLLRHPNIVLFYGAGYHQGSPFMVTEYCERGSLYDVYLNHETHLALNFWIQFLLDAARGIAFLHSKQRIHRDLKSLNLLVTSDWTAKVADFGTARKLLMVDQTEANEMDAEEDLGDANPLMTTRIGTTCWSAPEVLQQLDYGTPCDIYSLGIVMWETAARSPPFVQERSPWTISRKVIEGVRPPLDGVPIYFSRAYVEVMQRCWAQEAEYRPTADELVDALQAILSTSVVSTQVMH